MIDDPASQAPAGNRSQTILGIVLGLIAVAAGLYAVLYFTKGNHLELVGNVTSAKTYASDEHASVMVLQMQLNNPSDIPFAVREAIVNVTDKDGNQIKGDTFAEVDLKRFLTAYPDLGDAKLPTLRVRNRIAPHQGGTYLLGVRFDVDEAVLKSRKGLTVRIQEIDGTVSEVH